MQRVPPEPPPAAWSEQAVQEVYERFETACDDLDSGLFDLDQRHCYCCMQFFGGAGGSQVLNKGGHVCSASAATRCTARARTVASTTSSRPPRAPTTAAVAALAAVIEVSRPRAS